jgi:hypothetical protein
MHLTRAEDFTHYDEGCPLHPSWPAMHSASSAASLWLASGRRLDATSITRFSARLRSVVRSHRRCRARR